MRVGTVFGPSLAIVLAIFVPTMLGFVSPAQAQQRQTFHIPAQKTEDALLDLALQSRRSLGGDIGACQTTSRAVNGSLTVDAALAYILAGSGCRHTIHADGAIFIRSVRSNVPARSPVHQAVPERVTSSVSQVSDVIVTSGRHPEIPQRAPAAISALSGHQLQNAGVIDFNDVASLTAGMTVTNLGAGRNKILLRGMSDGAFTGLTQSTVALYLDSIPITYSAPDPDLKLIDVDRVELLRGPQGTLYGTGPIGGVVHIVTRTPDFDRMGLNLSLTSSRTRGGGPNSDYSATANLPLLHGRLAVRGSIYEESFGGYIKDVSLNIPSVNDGTRHGGRLAVAAAIAPGWSTVAGFVHQSIDTEDTHYVFRTLRGLTRANLVREPHENDFDEVYITLQGRGEWGHLDASIARVEHRFISRYDASSALSAFGSGGRFGALDESKRIDLLVGELTLSSADKGRFRWLAGGFFSGSDTGSDTVLSSLRPVVTAVYSEDRSDKLDELAVFGEVSYALTPAMTVTVGARYYGFDYETRSDVAQGNRKRAFSRAGNSTGLSPKLALAYHVNDRLDLYGQISQGHRAGGFNTAGPIGQKFNGVMGAPAREYRPDTLWNYETGAKATFWDGRVQSRVALFLARWSDIQSDQFLPSGLAYAVNVGDGANKGIEIETNWRVNDNLDIRANALAADPQITRPGSGFNSRGDAGLPGVPAISANLNIGYRRPLWRDISLTTQANAAYVGASRLTFDAEKRYRMGDYVTGRVSVGVEADHWSLTAFVDNPLDAQANTFSFGDPFRLPEALASTPLRPRTIGLTLTANR